MTFKTNSAETTRRMTDWYFGRKFVEAKVTEAQKESKKNGQKTFRFWQEGTGYLTIIL